jgi:DNA-binding CsgD family transcriptional regulator/tetratricopeptide (TPR) repeat protein
MSSSPFVGREAARSALTTALDAAADGRGSTINVVGPSGMGKTRLLEEFAENASAFEQLLGRADPRRLDRAFSALPAPLMSAAAGAALGSDVSDTSIRSVLTGPRTDDGFVALDAVVEEIQRRAARRPQLLIVDDAQWADRASALALQSVARRLTDEAILLVVAHRPAPSDWSTLFTDLAVTDVTLGPLSDDEVDQLVAAFHRPGRDPRPHLAGAGGNPFLILEALAGYPDGRLAGAPEELVEALRLAAVLGPIFRAADLAAVAGRPAADLVGPLRLAIDAGILLDDDELRFTHELIREQLLIDLPESVRRALHTEAAVHLARSGADASVVTHHLLAGDGTVHPDAARWLRRAAAEVAMHNPERAVEILRKAADGLPRDTDEWVEAAADLAQALVLAGNLTEAEECATSALSTRSPIRQRPLRQVLVQARFARGDLSEALGQLERIERIDTSEGQKAVARAESATLRLLTFDLAGARKEATAVVSGSAGTDSAARSVANIALSSVEMAEGNTDRAVAFAEDAIRDADESPFGQAHMFHPHLFAALAYSNNDQADESRDALRTSHEVGRRRGTGWEVPLRHGALAAEHYRSGLFDDCEAECEAGLQLSGEHDVRLADVLLTSHLALIALHRGRLDEVEQRLEEADFALARLGPRIGSTHLVWAKALYLEATGDLDQARGLLQVAVDFATAAGVIGRLSTIGPDLTRMAVAERDDDTARVLVEHLEELAERSGAPSIRGAALRSRAWAHQDADAARAAVECFVDCERPLEEARTREDAGRILWLHGSRDTAVALINEAREFFEHVGASADVERIALLDPSRASKMTLRPTTGWDALTGSEQKVSLLVAEGLSNPEVGERLFISRRTVETHLYRTYTKLQVSSRVELTLLVEREGRSRGEPAEST